MNKLVIKDLHVSIEGKKILTHRDEFVERMSPFDRSARLKTDRTVSEKNTWRL